jgi:hypothetical protein
MMNFRPNLFLVGAMKAGTTSLATALAAHPDIFACPIKEPNHFCREIHEAQIASLNPSTRRFDLQRYLSAETLEPLHFAFVERAEDYEELFRGWSGQPYLLDASTRYLNSPVAADLIREYNADAKIIAVLRDPIERGWSEFLMNMRIGTATADPIAALERESEDILNDRTPLFERYVSTGFYDFHLAKFDVFPPEQVLVLQLQDLRTDWAGQLSKIYRFLGVDAHAGIDRPVRENVGGRVRFAVLNHLLHATGVKYLARDLLPTALATKAKSLLVISQDNERERRLFSEAFPEYSAMVAHKFALS